MPGELDRRATGFSPTELLLAGAGACAAWDVVEMVRKRRAALRDVSVQVDGFQADAVPWHYELVALHFRVDADGISIGALERVVRLAVVRYCSVVATLRGVARIEATLELVDGSGGSSGRVPVNVDSTAAEVLPLVDPTLVPPIADEA